MEFVQTVQALQNEVLTRYLERKAYTVQGLAELEKQVLIVYLFGMVNGLKQEKFEEIPPV